MFGLPSDGTESKTEAEAALKSNSLSPPRSFAKLPDSSRSVRRPSRLLIPTKSSRDLSKAIMAVPEPGTAPNKKGATLSKPNPMLYMKRTQSYSRLDLGKAAGGVGTGVETPRSAERRKLLVPITSQAVRSMQSFHNSHMSKSMKKIPVKRIFIPAEGWKKARGVLEFIRHVRHITRDMQLYGNPTKTTDPFLSRSLLNAVAAQPGGDFPGKDDVPRFMFHPNSLFSILWSVVVALLLLYSAFIVPFRLAFINNEGTNDDFWQLFEYTVDSMFFLDIIITFFSAYYDEEERLVTSRCQIAHHYLAFRFYIDLVACFPLSLFYSMIGGTTSPSNFIALRLLRLPRLYRFLKFFSFVKHMTQGRRSNFFSDVIQLNSCIISQHLTCSFAATDRVHVHAHLLHTLLRLPLVFHHQLQRRLHNVERDRQASERANLAPIPVFGQLGNRDSYHGRLW